MFVSPEIIGTVLAGLRTEMTEVKIAVARLEGPAPRLLSR